MKTWCIYKHTNIINNKAYIGLTCQKPNLRWGHGTGYRKSCQRLFATAIEKYGWENFKHEILEENIKTLEEANNRERYWIAYYHTYINDPETRGYNMTIGGDGAPGHVVSADTKRILAEKSTGQISVKRKAVLCIETNKIFNSIMEASKETGANISKISLCCNNKIRTAGGYHWAFILDKDKIKKESLFKNKSPIIKKSSAKRQIKCVELNLVFDSITSAASYIGGTKYQIWNCLANKSKTAYGYTWIYL